VLDVSLVIVCINLEDSSIFLISILEFVSSCEVKGAHYTILFCYRKAIIGHQFFFFLFVAKD
jgi:hypothetical protein